MVHNMSDYRDLDLNDAFFEADIRSYDENYLKHGYHETYCWPLQELTNQFGLWLRVNYYHGIEKGYEEYHGELTTTYYII